MREILYLELHLKLEPERDLRKKTTLKRKIIWIVILTTMSSILVFFLINEKMFFDHYRELIYREQIERVNQVCDRIGSFIGEVRNLLHIKAESSVFQNLETDRMKSDLQKVVDRQLYIRGIAFYDINGSLQFYVVRTGQPAREFLKIEEILDDGSKKAASNEGVSMGNIQYDKLDIPLLDITVPVVDNSGQLHGFLSAKIELSHIYKIIKALYNERQTFAYLLDLNGKLILHPGKTRFHSNFSWSSIPPVKMIMERKFEETSTKLPVYTNADGLRVIGMGGIVPNSKWGFVLERSESEAYGELYKHLWMSLAISIVILLICVLVLYKYITYLLSPFEKLREGAEAFASENLKYRIDVKTGDEIEDLANTFNRMAASIEQQKESQNQVMEELKRKKKELEITNLHLKEASRLKSEFLANMSHELRTPLNTIIGYTSIIIDGIYGELTEKQEASLKKIYQNARNLSHLINDVLDTSKIDAGKMPIFKERFLISQVINEVIQFYKPTIKEKGLELKLNIRHDLEIETDRSKIKQVIDHLVSNAVKFTHKGSIQVLCEKTEVEDYLRICVTDTGIGIEPHNLECIFEEFRQLDGSFTREYGGTGLGLSIVKKILNILGAKMTVKSKVGEGSTFTLLLPLKESQQERKLEKKEDEVEKFARADGIDTSEIEDVTKKVILVIDDDPDALNMMKDIVRGTDFRVVGAGSAIEGFELARNIRPYIITTDIFMPDMDGLELIKKLKKDPITLDIPVFIISISDEREKGYSAGATEYFVKPIDRNLFLNRLAVINSIRGKRILIIDDDHSFLESFYRVMREHGFLITSCEDPRQGIEKLKNEKPDLLVLDLMMPKMSGYDLLDLLEKEGLTKDVPVVILTAKEVTTSEMEQLTGRVVSVVKKTGISREELLPKLRSIFERIWCSRNLTSESAGQVEV